MNKGTRVKIIDGPGTGSQGEVFWWGESKFGDGMRAGVKGDDGETYWVDEEHLEEASGAAPEKPAAPAVPSNPNAFSRGDRVKITKGKEAGAEGEIFWWGESKFGDGMRAGVETDSGDKVWASEFEMEKIAGSENAEPKKSAPVSTSNDGLPDEAFAPSLSEPEFEDIPLPEEPPPMSDGMSLADVMSYEDD